MELGNLLQKEKPKVEEYIVAGKYRQLLSYLYLISRPFLMPCTEYDLYCDVTPYDSKVSARYGIEYVNASFVAVHGDQYIACQEPKREFVGRFLSLVERSGANVIIALKADCAYSGEAPVVSTETVFLEGSPFLMDEIIRVGERSVRRVTCVAWEDHSIMSERQLEFLHEYLSRFGNEMKIIHCRAGVGRTGTFIMYRALRRLGRTTAGAFADLLIQLRCQRNLLVQSASQLEFLANKFLR